MLSKKSFQGAENWRVWASLHWVPVSSRARLCTTTLSFCSSKNKVRLWMQRQVHFQVYFPDASQACRRRQPSNTLMVTSGCSEHAEEARRWWLGGQEPADPFSRHLHSPNSLFPSQLCLWALGTGAMGCASPLHPQVMEPKGTFCPVGHRTSWIWALLAGKKNKIPQNSHQYFCNFSWQVIPGSSETSEWFIEALQQKYHWSYVSHSSVYLHMSIIKRVLKEARQSDWWLKQTLLCYQREMSRRAWPFPLKVFWEVVVLPLQTSEKTWKTKGFFDQLTWHIARESPQTNRELLVSAQTALGTWGTAPTCETPKSTWAVPPAPHPAAPMGPWHQHPRFARQGGGWWAHQAEGFPAEQREIAYDRNKKNFKRSKTKHLVAETNIVMLSKDVSSRWGLENKKHVWMDLQRNFFPSTLLYNW